jgi:hypothetical protein
MRLLVKDGSGVATCDRAHHPAGKGLGVPHVLRLQTHLSVQEGSGVATCGQCDKTSSKKRDLSPKIISGDSR